MTSNTALDKLTAFTRATIRYLKEKGLYHSPTATEYITVDTKTLKAILLATGGVFKVICDGVAYSFAIKNRHLGVGVYNVWIYIKLEKQNA